MSFIFVSGNVALDFLGTLKWRRSEPEELLTSPSDVQAWAQEADVINVPFTVSEMDYRRVLDFRESLYHLVANELSGQPAPQADVEILNSKLKARTPRLELKENELVKTGDVASMEASIASAAAELLTSAEKTKLKECGRKDCTRVFIDRSRSGTRTWCGMEECGNRIKAANYRSRRKAKSDSPSEASFKGAATSPQTL